MVWGIGDMKTSDTAQGYRVFGLGRALTALRALAEQVDVWAG